VIRLLIENKEKEGNKKNLRTLINSFKIIHDKLTESNKKIEELKIELKNEKSGDFIG